jgi:hypothetical protein
MKKQDIPDKISTNIRKAYQENSNKRKKPNSEVKCCIVQLNINFNNNFGSNFSYNLKLNSEFNVNANFEVTLSSYQKQQCK